jgi:hypothetical protein
MGTVYGSMPIEIKGQVYRWGVQEIMRQLRRFAEDHPGLPYFYHADKGSLVGASRHA